VNREEAEKHFGPAVTGLAKVLYEKVERLDPRCCGGSEWDKLPTFDLRLYASCIEELLDYPELLIAAAPDDDMVLWKSEILKKMHFD
jgi:hypothetical protein